MTDVFSPSTLRGDQRLSSLQGLPGPPGSATYSGATPPALVIGVDGDVYLQNDVNGVILKAYQKLSGVWAEVGQVNPAWQTFSPTVTAESGTITSFSSIAMRYRLIGTVCFVFASLIINVAGTGAGAIKISLPVNVIVTGACVTGIATVGTGVAVTGFVLPPGLLAYPSMSLLKYDGTTLIANGRQIIASTAYETA